MEQRGQFMSSPGNHSMPCKETHAEFWFEHGKETVSIALIEVKSSNKQNFFQNRKIKHKEILK
jgi:general stress protein 26